MNTDKLIDALGEISDDMILDAAPGRGKSAAERRNRRQTARWLAAAACFCVVIGGAIIVGTSGRAGAAAPGQSAAKEANRYDDRQYSMNTASIPEESIDAAVPNVIDEKNVNIASDGNTNTANPLSETANTNVIVDSEQEKALPMLNLSPLIDGGGGGALLYKKGTAPKAEPLVLDSIPDKFAAYKNNSFSGAGFPYGLSEEQMQELFDSYSGILGIKSAEAEKEYGSDPEVYGNKDVLTKLSASENGYSLTVAANAGITIRNESKGLSEEEIQSVLNYPDQSTETVLMYTQTESKPVRPGSNMYIGTGPYSVRNAYENVRNSSDELQQASIALSNSAGAELKAISLYIFNGDMVSSLVGEYPSISYEKALKMLEEGRFVQGLGADEFPGIENIISCDIRYVVKCTQEYFLPFYHFWVKLPDEVLKDYGEEAEKTMEAYAEYYVPAIDDKYIAKNPLVWN